MRLQTIRNLICPLTIAAILSITSFAPVTAEEIALDTDLLEETPEYIQLVTEPDNIPEDVYYVMDKQKSDPASFTWVQDSVKKNALQLDGETQHIRLSTARVKELEAFTFSAWVNWAGNAKDDKEQRLLCVYKNKNHSLILSPHNIDEERKVNGIQLTLEDPQIEPISLHHSVEGNVTSALELNEWHHIAVTLSDTEIALYLDGTIYASQKLDNFSLEKMDPYRLVIGSEFEGDAQFNGLVDNALLYTQVLDADQIGLLAQNKEPKPGVKPTTKKEVLATKPYANETISEEDDAIRILGLSPVLFATLGIFVVLAIVLSLVLSLYRKKFQRQPEREDYL